MLEKYVNYVSSDASAWQNVFNMLINFEQNTTSFRQGAARIVEIMNNWNEQNMGQIQLDAAAQEFVARQAG